MKKNNKKTKTKSKYEENPKLKREYEKNKYEKNLETKREYEKKTKTKTNMRTIMKQKKKIAKR